MGNFDERDKHPPQPVVIEDKRHGRVDEEIDDSAGDEEAQAEAVDSPPPVVSVSPEQELWPSGADGHETAASQSAASASSEAVAADALDDLGELTDEQLAAAQQAEMAYLMQLFQLGQTGYLRSQLGVLLNFAMINLGRMPNPATGIVTANLEEAKVAIDIFEFILVKLQAQLEPRERMELTQLLSDMKYTFMQALGGGAATVPPGEG